MMKYIVALLFVSSFALPAYAQSDEPSCDDLPDRGAVYNEETNTWGFTPCIDRVVVVGRERTTFRDFIMDNLIPFINGYVIQVLYVVAFLFFIYGMFKFFFTGGEENRQKGRQFAVWGIIGFVVLFSVWSLVGLLLGSFFPSLGGGRGNVGHIPPGGICRTATECQSGFCTQRGLYTSTCE